MPLPPGLECFHRVRRALVHRIQHGARFPDWMTIEIVYANLFTLFASRCLRHGVRAPAKSAIANYPVPSPTFTGSFMTNGKQYSYTIAGRKPESGGTTTIPTVVVPLSLSFDGSGGRNGHTVIANAEGTVREIYTRPFSNRMPLPPGTRSMATPCSALNFIRLPRRPAGTRCWESRHVTPPVQIEIPVANGYVLHSKRTGKSLAVVDLDFVQKQLFQQLASIGAGPDKLLIALTSNVAFYSLGDATVCCSVGTHGTSILQEHRRKHL